MDHAPGFLKLVNEAKPYVKEITIDQARERLKQNPQALLMDRRRFHAAKRPPDGYSGPTANEESSPKLSNASGAGIIHRLHGSALRL